MPERGKKNIEPTAATTKKRIEEILGDVGWAGKLLLLLKDIWGLKSLLFILAGMVVGIGATNFFPERFLASEYKNPDTTKPSSLRKPEKTVPVQISARSEQLTVATITPPLSWVSSGAWSDDGKNLFLIGSHHHQDHTTSAKASLLKFRTVNEDIIYPLRLADRELENLQRVFKMKQGIALELNNLNILHATDELELIKEYDLSESRNEFNIPIQNLRSNIATTSEFAIFLGESLYRDRSCSEFLRHNKLCPEVYNWKGVFSRVAFDQISRASSLHSISTSDPNWQFYSLGFPLVASMKDIFYFLSIESKPCIFAVNAQTWATPVCRSTIPEEYVDLPTWPDNYQDTRDAIRQRKLVMGIYSQGPWLYLVLRMPEDASGSTSWELLRVAPADGKIQQNISLPTSSPYITLVPGPLYWAIVEHGDFPFSTPNRSSIRSISLVSSEAITAGSSS